MGGQQFGRDTLHLDTTGFNRVLGLDKERGLVRVQGGIQWPELLAFLHTEQQSNSRVWSIRQKQTGVDRVSLAGTLSANAHGRGLRMQPIVGDVESLVIVDANGEAVTCSRQENAELFSLVIGGYGLFGVVAEVTLRLALRTPVQRTVEVIEVRDLIDKVQSRIGEGYEFGDCQYSTDFSDLGQSHRGVFSCYKPPERAGDLKEGGRKLTAEDWTKLIYLGHLDKRRAFETYAAHYLATDGQVYWSDTHQLSNNFDGYHAVLDKQLNSQHKGSEMITEVYVRRERLTDFLRAARKAVHDHGINLIYGTIRFIEKDDVTFLAWAKEQSTCVLCNLHVDHTEHGLKTATDHARRLIQIAVDHGGRYFPTYHRWATRQQVVAAYPQITDFLKLKKKYDREERFQSEWYRHYRQMFVESV
jgi:FAD/FMN-containing dehydrogenase